MNRGICLCALLAGLSVAYSTSANTVEVQGSVLRHVESTLPLRDEVKAQTFTVLDEKKHEVSDIKPSEGENSFYIHRIELDNVPPAFRFLQVMVNKGDHKNYGISEINRLVQGMNAKLVDKGYVTSKVYIEPQNLKSGVLKLSLLVGTVEEIL